jgi:uncharacterized protein (DUF1810 family)
MERDPFNLERFVTAQSTTFDIALAELHDGRKQSHWMWFIFPQLRGLGVSETARQYGVTGLDEARAYLAHPVLAPRLEQVTRAVLATNDLSLRQIFGTPDDLKFHSSMTLFALACSPKECPFRAALDRWFSSRMDARSLAVIGERERRIAETSERQRSARTEA